MTKSEALAFRVSPELKQALQRLATADDRSLSSYIERLLRAHVDAPPQANAGTTARREAAHG